MDNKKTVTIRARVSASYADRVSKDAKSLGLSLSDYVRIAVNEKLERKK